MDILLINPNYRSEYHNERVNVTPPINLMYLAQSLTSAGFKCQIIDAYANNYVDFNLARIVNHKKPKFILYPLYSLTLPDIYSSTKYLKDRFPEIEIILGGVHTTAMPQKVLEEFTHINYIIKGEAENIIVQVMQKLIEGKSLKLQKGISYREKNKFRHNPINNELDINKVEIPSRKFIDIKKYRTTLTNENPCDVIITSRGCSFKCTFCDKLTLGFRKYRERTPQNIIRELNIIQENGAKSVEVFDELFIYNKKRIQQLLDLMRKEKIDLEFRIRTRVDSVNKELLMKLKRNRCHTISYGVESGSQAILDSINKGITLRRAEETIKLTKKIGIGTLGFFIIGHLQDTPQTIKQTVNFAKKLNPDYATFTRLIAFPETPVYNEAKKRGWLINDYSIHNKIPHIKLPWMKSEEELQKIVSKAYASFYRRPSYITKSFARTISKGYFNQLWFMAKNALKDIKRVSVQ